MKRVYVETNFLVALLRPFPGREAQELNELHQSGKLRLSVPWCALKEAQRTFERVIRDDVGFEDLAWKAWAQLFQADSTKWKPHGNAVTDFIEAVRGLRATALSSIGSRLQSFANSVDVIPPSEKATDFTLRLSRRKELKPFDEAILGCILADAQERRANGERDFVFCSTDKDLRPTADNGLKTEYDGLGIRFLPGFALPGE